jgi:hypothetical protein
LQRQQLNFNRALEAAAANQRTGLGLSTANLDALMRARMSNQQTSANMSMAQGQLDQNDNQFNAQQLDNTNRYNMGLLGTSAQMADQERARQLGVQQDSYNFGLQTDPRMMIAGLGTPLSNMTSLGAQLAQTNLQPVYSGGQFSSGGGIGTAMGAGGALLGAGVGALLAAPTGGMSVPMGVALGSSLGGATGSLGGSFFR